VVPKPIAKSGEEERGRFAADAGECQQDASDDSLGRGLHHDMDNGFPPADAERERRFAITIGYQ
jgi:hypothetical protein